jgi:hypothetical protein
MVLALAAALVLSVSPAQPARDGLVHVHVTGLNAPAADVVIHGGIASGGKMFGLVPLRDLGGGSWTAVLRAPGFPGVYPVRVRTQGVYRETGTVVAILPRGFATGPEGATPAGAVEAWREAAPGGATLQSATTWKRGFYFRRDQRFNRLLRVSFVLLRDWPRYSLKAGRYSRWFDVMRTSPTGTWRFAGFVAAP